MPLPSALAARLAKRGIVEKPEPVAKSEEESKPGEEVEEVFAEDYDDPSAVARSGDEDNNADVVPPEGGTLPADPVEDQQPEEEEDTRLVHESSACPNKSNSYHECSEFCEKHWGFKPFTPDAELDPKRLRMLNKYPLPDDWEEVGDPETGRYYYWNTNTDEVSWLPPSHPRTNISLPAERLKELFEASKPRDADSDSLSDEEDIMDIDDFEEIERKILMEKSAKEKERSKKEGRKRGREDKLDPMDPAAYSDIPRGTWSTGLDKRGSAKTGVDATASGPLFQMRPYPSPGAILRMNKEMTGAPEDDDEKD